MSLSIPITVTYVSLRLCQLPCLQTTACWLLTSNDWYYLAMLGQLLVTLLVIVLATLYVRKRAQRERARKTDSKIGSTKKANPWREKPPRKSAASDTIDSTANTPDLRVLLSAAFAMMLTLGGTLYYLAWQDARKSVTVILHRDDTNRPVIYEVRKRDLGERSFTTVDGTRVSVSANERIEIIGL